MVVKSTHTPSLPRIPRYATLRLDSVTRGFTRWGNALPSWGLGMNAVLKTQSWNAGLLRTQVAKTLLHQIQFRVGVDWATPPDSVTLPCWGPEQNRVESHCLCVARDVCLLWLTSLPTRTESLYLLSWFPGDTQQSKGLLDLHKNESKLKRETLVSKNRQMDRKWVTVAAEHIQYSRVWA